MKKHVTQVVLTDEQGDRLFIDNEAGVIDFTINGEGEIFRVDIGELPKLIEILQDMAEEED